MYEVWELQKVKKKSKLPFNLSTSKCFYDKYAYGVLSKKILACRWVRLACQRYKDDRKDGHKRGLHFDKQAAQHIIDFFPAFLKFYEGDFDGLPFILQPWQQFIVANLFGWKTADGYRRFRTAYIEVSKGQGKTPMGAGIGLYGLIFDGEPGAEIYSAATQREQAGILFRDAKAFVNGSSDLLKRLEVGIGNIANISQNSFFRCVSSEHRGLDGKRPHMALIDEIHEHPDAIVVDKMRAGTKGRTQALIFEITNSGYDRQSVCFQHHEYSEKILQKVINNDSWFTFMTGLDVCKSCLAGGMTIPTDGCSDCDDWQDEKVWLKACPNLGVSIKLKYLREQVAEAKDMPSKQNIVKRLNFNIWTESVTKWISTDKWNACSFAVDRDALRGRTCYGGLDLSSTIDISAWVLVFPPVEENGKYEILCRFYIPEDNMGIRIKRNRVPYDVWVRDGFITPTPGNVIDYDWILKQIDDDMQAFDIQEIAFDRWGATAIVQKIQEKSQNEDFLIPFGQGFASMAAPTKELEKMILKKEIAHGGNAVLRWMASNAVIMLDPAGNMKVVKDKSTEKVDGIIALIMALDRALKHTIETSIYETRPEIISG